MLNTRRLFTRYPLQDPPCTRKGFGVAEEAKGTGRVTSIIMSIMGGTLCCSPLYRGTSPSFPPRVRLISARLNPADSQGGG